MNGDTAQIIKTAAALGVLGSGRHSGYQLLGMLSNPALDLTEVCRLIERDPGLTARVLRVANSAFYGVPRSVTTVQRAIALLGVNAVRGIAAAACLDRTITNHGDAPIIDLAGLVRHSVASALAAESLAQRGQPSQAGEAFIAGLLHDLGVLVQSRMDGPGQLRLIQALQSDPTAAIADLEPGRVAVGHEHCAAVVFQSWQLPEQLTAAACHHHRPLSAPQPQRRLTALVYLGVQASLMAGFTYDLAPGPEIIAPAILADAGLERAEVDAVADELPRRMAELAG